MEIIGITGKAGTGKSTFATLLAQKYKYCTKIGLDEFATKALENPFVLKKIVNGSSKDVEEAIQSVILEVQKQTYKVLDSSNAKTIILEWRLLPHIKCWNECDTRILLIADEQQRRNKLMQRDNRTEEELDAQEKWVLDYNKCNSNYTVKNNYNEKELYASVNKIYNDLSLDR